MFKRLTLAALAATLAAGAAHAQDGPPPPGPRPDPFAMADKNKDGVITREEMLAGVEARFKEMDANHDGKVTPEEREAFHSAMRARMAARMGHAPKDMTLAEEQQRAARLFDRVDTNHDGKIDAAERAAAREKMRTMMRGGRGGRHGPPPPPPPADAN